MNTQRFVFALHVDKMGKNWSFVNSINEGRKGKCFQFGIELKD